MNEKNEKIHTGHRERLKERFEKEGLDSFEPHEILELLLFYCIPLKDTNSIAHRLLDRFGSLSRVFEADVSELREVDGIGAHAASLLSLIPHVGRAYLQDAVREKPLLNTSKAAGEYVRNFFVGRIYEVFYLFCLDKSCRVIYEEKIFEGTLDETPFYPREILERAFRHNAQKVILAHNHPSGTLRPSFTDVENTHNIVEIFDRVGIEVADHIIVGRDSYVSMADLGCLRKNVL